MIISSNLSEGVRVFIVFKVIEIDLQFLFILAHHFANRRLTFHNNNRILVKGFQYAWEAPRYWRYPL